MMGALDDSHDERLASHHDGNPNFPDDPTDPSAEQPLWPQATRRDLDEESRWTIDGRPPRPLADIRLDLDLARAYQQRYRDRPTDDRLVQLMRDANEADIARLQAELEAVTGVESSGWAETAGESAVIDDYRRTARAAKQKGVPDDGGGIDLPGATGSPETTVSTVARRWPKRGRGLRDTDLGL